MLRNQQQRPTTVQTRTVTIVTPSGAPSISSDIRPRPKTQPQIKQTCQFNYCNISGTTSSSSSSEKLKKQFPLSKAINRNIKLSTQTQQKHNLSRLITAHPKRNHVFVVSTKHGESIGDHVGHSVVVNKQQTKPSTNRIHLSSAQSAPSTKYPMRALSPNALMTKSLPVRLSTPVACTKSTGIPSHCAARAAYYKSKESTDNNT